MTKTLFLTLFAALFLIGGTAQSFAHCGKCGDHAAMKQAPCEKCLEAKKPCTKCKEAKEPCEKCMDAGKTCKCGKHAKKPCKMKMDGKPCMKCAGKDHDPNMRTGDEVRSNIGSLKMKSGISGDSYND